MRLPGWIVTRLYRSLRGIADRREPDFVIGGSEHPYLRRWWVIPRNRWFNIYLHQILRSDDDRALHDHPWPNASLILEGGYREVVTINGHFAQEWRDSDAGFIFRRATAAHRLEVDEGRDTWTLFLTGPVVREWGFHCPQGWRHWREFVDGRDSGSVGRGCD